jgi:hypothetical protein
MDTSNATRFQVGSILHGSWGYEQTNCEFYKVVRATANSVWMVKLCNVMVDSNGLSSMASNVVPGEPAADGKVYGPARICKGSAADSCLEPRHKHAGLTVWNGKPKYSSWYA